MRRRGSKWLAILMSCFSAVVETTSYSSSYSNGYADESLELNVCEDSVVAVTYMTALCDSPYTFYYGNGANRNSVVCDYGDKVTLQVTFKVLDDLQESDTEIYVTMAAYDNNNNLLTSTYPEYLCKDYVGKDCTKAGTYSFEKKLKFGNPYGNETKFYPVIHMAFSTKGDSGYNLGAVNMQCQQWDKDQPVYVSWSNESPKTRAEEVLSEYSLLIGTGFLILGISIFVWKQAKENPGFNHFPPYLHHDDSGDLSSFMDL
jgi:hypothetical protein